MEIAIFRNEEQTTVVIEKAFEITTYKFFDLSMVEIAEFVKVLTEEK